MNFRLIGFSVCILAFFGAMWASYIDSTNLVIIESAMIVAGAVLSLHKKPGKATTFHINASPGLDEARVAQMAQRATQYQ